MKLMGIIGVGFDVTGQLLLIRSFAFFFSSISTGEKWEYSKTVHQLFVDFKKAHDLVWGEVLYSILTEFGVPMKLAS
jgi:hypothetical protein